MDMRRNVIRCLLMLALLLGITGIAIAEPFVALYQYQWLTFHQWDAHDPVGWEVQLVVMGPKETLGSQDYFHLEIWNYYNSTKVEEQGYFRSTEQALYGYNPTGPESLQFQKGPVGTKWNTPREAHGYHYEVTEIVAIEAVTVPYGTFDQAYKYRKFNCYDPDNLGLGKSPDRYEWVVPGIGMVKEEDYWCDYPPGINELTSLITAPVYRFWSPVLSRHFYTTSEAEKRKLINTYSHVWTYEQAAYYTLAGGTAPNTVPVYRFWSGILNAHFYTISESERDKLINDYPDVWTYEGPKFFAWPAGRQPADASPVYRFWSDSLGCHFYTISESEKTKLINQYPHVWAYEGIAWYAYQ